MISYSPPPIPHSTKNFEKSGDYANAWNKNDDGQVNTNGPRVQVGDAMGMQGNIVTRLKFGLISFQFY